MQSPEAKAESARYAFHRARWGYLTTLDNKGLPVGEVASFSDGAQNASTGRLWFYLMEPSSVEAADGFAAAITVSEASYNATCGFAGSLIDPEDPRCAKITMAGTMKKSTGGDIATGQSALFAKHPQMKTWPAGHGFAVHELHLEDVWMIDFYGGGGAVDLKLYGSVQAQHNVPSFPGRRLAADPVEATRHEEAVSIGGAAEQGPATRGPSRHATQGAEAPGTTSTSAKPPPASDAAVRARWLVANSLWSAVSTVSVRLPGKPWANVRSVADGTGANSTGKPVMYLPTPDPTSVDIAANPHCAVSFSEAALPQRVTRGGTCGGMDAEDPTCARLVLSGMLRALESKGEIEQAMIDLGERHPKAPWLAQGGAHTGGKYFQLEVASLSFLDTYGGFAKLSVPDYLAGKPKGNHKGVVAEA
jgi:hypothetical protein